MLPSQEVLWNQVQSVAGSTPEGGSAGADECHRLHIVLHRRRLGPTTTGTLLTARVTCAASSVPTVLSCSRSVLYDQVGGWTVRLGGGTPSRPWEHWMAAAEAQSQTSPAAPQRTARIAHRAGRCVARCWSRLNARSPGKICFPAATCAQPRGPACSSEATTRSF